MDAAPASRRAGRGEGVVLAAVALWFFAAGLAQVLYLAHWPMHLFGVRVSPWAAAVVAILRLGLYGGLAWGVLRRIPFAWVTAEAELMRTFGLFLLVLIQQGWKMDTVLYPAVWAQGLMTAALVPVAGAQMALGAGWRPGSAFEHTLGFAIRMAAAACGIAAIWLRRRHDRFELSPSQGEHLLLTRGVPASAALLAVEGAAAMIARAAVP